MTEPVVFKNSSREKEPQLKAVICGNLLYYVGNTTIHGNDLISVLDCGIMYHMVKSKYKSLHGVVQDKHKTAVKIYEGDSITINF